MSDDEQPSTPQRPKDEETVNEDGKSETQVRMEQEKKRRAEKAAEEMAEYEEVRKIEREKEAEEIRLLRERRTLRKKEREEEEKRLAEQRSQEDQKRKAEEEERGRKKRDEENKKKEAREMKRKEYEEKTNKKGPNFKINKKATEHGGEEPAEAEAKPSKSKEQLESERKAELEKRYHSVKTDGMGADQLREKAKELHNTIYRLESDKYDLMKRFEQQNYDMMELSERARQISKGASKNAKVNVNQAPDPLASKFSGIPPKVIMYSQYERVKDRRSFGERTVVFVGPLYADEYKRIEPATKVVMTEQGAKVIELEGGGGADENATPAENGVED